MWNETRKRLPTKRCNVGTDWSELKGFDIYYISFLFMSEPKAKALGNFRFYRKVERVYKEALRQTKQIANVRAKLHTEQIIKP